MPESLGDLCGSQLDSALERLNEKPEKKPVKQSVSPVPPFGRPASKTESKSVSGAPTLNLDQPAGQPQPPPVDEIKSNLPESEPASHYLITSGLLTENNCVLWPRQVVKFSTSFCGYATNLAYYRWQVVVELEDIDKEKDSNESRERRFTEHYVVNPARHNNGQGISTHYLSRLTITRPDGYAGFTGAAMQKSQSFTVGEAYQLCTKMKPDPLLKRMPDAREDFIKAMKSILPVFYLALENVSLTTIEEELKRNPELPLREVFDVHERRWKWMYQLGEVDSTAPIVLSEPPVWLCDKHNCCNIGELHYKFSNDYAISDIYIGGSGLEFPGLPVDTETARVRHQNRYRILEQPLQELGCVLDPNSSDYRLKPVIFPVSERKTKDMAVEIQTIINGPGTKMVEKIRHRVRNP